MGSSYAAKDAGQIHIPNYFANIARKTSPGRVNPATVSNDLETATARRSRRAVQSASWENAA